MERITEDYMRSHGFEVIESDTKDWGRGTHYRKWQKSITAFRDVQFIHLDGTRFWTLCDGENRLHCKDVEQLNNAMRFIGVEPLFTEHNDNDLIK